jgi:hypothetical protein
VRQCASFVHSIHSLVRSFVRLDDDDDEDDDGGERVVYIYIHASCVVVRAFVRKRDGTGGGGISCSFIPVEN